MTRRSPVRTRAMELAPVGTTNPIAPGKSDLGVEGQLEQLEGRLAQLKAQVRQAQQLAGLGTAAATIAHEVNNLLTPLLGYAQYALDTDDPALSRKALTVTVKNVRLLVAMSERVLGITAARAPTSERVTVRSAALDAAASLCRDLSKDGIQFVVDLDEQLGVQADPLQLQQVFFNLFLNARNAMAASHNGRLSVSGRREDGQVIVEVCDTGKGIPPDLLPHIFDPLQSSKPATGDRCAGLGLALCRDLVQENGGTIRVASTPNAGTTFTIVLPGA